MSFVTWTTSLPLAEQLVDRREEAVDEGASASPSGRGASASRPFRGRRLAAIFGGSGSSSAAPKRSKSSAPPHVGDVEERVLLEAEVDEGRLHAGQDARDAPLVDVPDDAAAAAGARSAPRRRAPPRGRPRASPGRRRRSGAPSASRSHVNKPSVGDGEHDPVIAHVATSEEPPYEMKGSVMPVVGRKADVHGDVPDRLEGDVRHEE